MLRRLTLTEHQPQTVRLEPRMLEALRGAVPSLWVGWLPGEGDTVQLTPGSYVGAVAVPGLAVDIQPKIGMQSLLFLLSFAMNPRWWREETFPFAETETVLDALAAGYLIQLRRAWRAGLLQGYQRIDDALPTLRGRLRIEDQLRFHQGRVPPAEVSFDEFTEDIELNRILKAATLRLRSFPLRSSWVRSELFRAESRLRDVTSMDWRADRLPEPVFDRLTQHYRPAVLLALQILRWVGIQHGQGTAAASALLIDMNTVFEDFVVSGLREALGVDARSFPQNARGRALYFDAVRRVRLEPDLSWWRGGRCEFVGDVKYKKTAGNKGENPDLYQLLAYATGTGLSHGLLVYAAGEGEPAIHNVAAVGTKLHVETLDVTGSPDEILGEVSRVASRIEQLRSPAVYAKAVTA